MFMFYKVIKLCYKNMFFAIIGKCEKVVFFVTPKMMKNGESKVVKNPSLLLLHLAHTFDPPK